MFHLSNFPFLKKTHDVAIKIAIYMSDESHANRNTYTEKAVEELPPLQHFITESNYAIDIGNKKLAPKIYSAFYYKVKLPKDIIRYIGVLVMQRYDSDVFKFLYEKNPIEYKKYALARMLQIIDEITNMHMFCNDIKPENFVIRRIKSTQNSNEANAANIDTPLLYDVRMIDFGTSSCSKKFAIFSRETL